MSIIAIILLILILLLGLQILANNGLQEASLHHILKAIVLGAGLLCPIAFALNQAVYLSLTPLILSIITTILIAICYFIGFRPKRSELTGFRGYTNTIWETAILVAVFIKCLNMLSTPLGDWDSFYYHLPLARSIVEGSFLREIGPSYNLEMMGAYPQFNFFLYALIKYTLPVLSYYALPKLYYFFMLLMISLSLNRILAANNANIIIRTIFLSLIIGFFPDYLSIQYLPCLILIYFIEAIYTNREKTFELNFMHGLFISIIFWSNYLGLLIILVLSIAALLYFRDGSLKLRMSFWVGISLIFIFLVRNLIMAHNPIYPGFFEVIGGVGVSEEWLKFYDITKRVPLSLIEQLELILSYWPALIPYFICVTIFIFKSIKRSEKYLLIPVIMGALYIILWSNFFVRNDTPYHRYLLPYAYLFIVLDIVEIVITIKLFQSNTIEKASNNQHQEHHRSNWLIPILVPIVSAIMLFSFGINRIALDAYFTGGIDGSLVWINKNLSPQATIFTMENKLFNLNRRFMPADSPKILNYYLEMDAKKALEALKKEGVTHVLYTGQIIRRSPFIYGIFMNDLETMRYQKIVYRDNYAVVTEIIYP